MNAGLLVAPALLPCSGPCAPPTSLRRRSTSPSASAASEKKASPPSRAPSSSTPSSKAGRPGVDRLLQTLRTSPSALERFLAEALKADGDVLVRRRSRVRCGWRPRPTPTGGGRERGARPGEAGSRGRPEAAPAALRGARHAGGGPAADPRRAGGCRGSRDGPAVPEDPGGQPGHGLPADVDRGLGKDEGRGRDTGAAAGRRVSPARHRQAGRAPAGIVDVPIRSNVDDQRARATRRPASWRSKSSGYHIWP